MEVPLDKIAQVELHVVPEVVKPEFVVCSIGYVTGIGAFPFLVDHPVDNDSHRKVQEVIDPAHPLGIPFCQIVVDRDKVHASPCKGIQVEREGCCQSLALASLHFGYGPIVQHDAAHKLDVKVTHPEDPY